MLQKYPECAIRSVISLLEALRPERDFKYLAVDTAYIPKAFGTGSRSAVLEGQEQPEILVRFEPEAGQKET